MTIRSDDRPADVRWQTVSEIVPDMAEPTDIGDVRLKPPYKPPTLDERIDAAFRVEGSPLERFQNGRRDAMLGRQRILIIFGDPKAKRTRQLLTLRLSDGEVRRACDPYRVMAVDSTGDKLADARALATSIGIRPDEALTGPSLYVVDADGRRRAHKDAEALLVDEAVSKDKLLDFLRVNTLEPLDARELLNDAIARAKRENKRVLVQETATWCAPCLLLSRFLDQHRMIWEKDYIWVKMDHRWMNAVDIMKEIRAGREGGIPWWAILDADGQVLIDSNAADGSNIGFPDTPAGRAHFRKMLEQTAIRMTPDDITALVDSLADEE